MPPIKKSKKILFVFNPKAGGKSKKGGIVNDMIKRFCIERNISINIYETTGSKDFENIQQLIKDSTFDAIIAVGGDGTINMVGQVLVGTKIPLGIVPHGSANGLAKDLNIPEDPEEALKIIGKFKPTPIDTIKINGIDSFHMCDVGFNARIIHRFSESIIRGKISYLWYGLLEFITVKSFSYTIQTPVLKYEGRSFMMIITNSKQFGTEVVINPLGKIDDGYFEIIIIKPFSKLMAPHVLYKLLTNTIHKSKYSKLIRCREAVINNKERESLHIDGEPQELGEILDVKIVPKGLYVLKP